MSKGSTNLKISKRQVYWDQSRVVYSVQAQAQRWVNIVSKAKKLFKITFQISSGTKNGDPSWSMKRKTYKRQTSILQLLMMLMEQVCTEIRSHGYQHHELTHMVMDAYLFPPPLPLIQRSIQKRNKRCCNSYSPGTPSTLPLYLACLIGILRKDQLIQV